MTRFKLIAVLRMGHDKQLPRFDAFDYPAPEYQWIGTVQEGGLGEHEVFPLCHPG